MGTKYYQDGANARRIRAYTREKVLEVLTSALEDGGYTIGEDEGELPLFKSGKAAAARNQEAEPFVLLAQNPTKSERCRVLGHDDEQGHSGKRFMWTFILQASAGKQSANITDEQKKDADDELMDVIRDAFESRYEYFRNQLFFNDIEINPSDQYKENAGLNPLTLTFYNYTRMATDFSAMTDASGN